MKRIGHLMEAIAAPDNLRLAFWKAAKTKRGRKDCQLFQEHLDQNLEELQLELKTGALTVGEYPLRGLLQRKFKDPTLSGLFGRTLASYRTTPGCGLPIGNLTSQHFANYYLAPLDRVLKEKLRRTAHVRYIPEQQHWIPLRPAPSSTRTPEGVGPDPAAIPSCRSAAWAGKHQKGSPGASSLAEPDENSGRPESDP